MTSCQFYETHSSLLSRSSVVFLRGLSLESFLKVYMSSIEQNFKDSSRVHARVLRWVHSPPYFFKLSFKHSVHGNQGHTGFGDLIRNYALILQHCLYRLEAVGFQTMNMIEFISLLVELLEAIRLGIPCHVSSMRMSPDWNSLREHKCRCPHCIFLKIWKIEMFPKNSMSFQNVIEPRWKRGRRQVC